MFLAGKGAWSAVVFILLTTGISGRRPTPLVSGADLTKEAPAVGHQNTIKDLQETLQKKGHYRGKVDGVFGLRTRASIRAYQKAQNLPATGQVDTQTADGLGVSPESSWDLSQSEDWKVGEGSARAAGESQREKPSAGVTRSKSRARKAPRQDVSRVAAIEDQRGDNARK